MNDFEEIEIDNDPQEPKPKFDPKKPFNAVNGKPSFDPNKPFEEKKKVVSTFSVENFSQGLKPSYNTSSPTKLKSQEQGVSERDLMGAPKSLLAEPQFSRNPNTLLDPEFEAKIEETNKPFNEFQSRVIGKRVGTANGDIYTPIDFDTNKREAYPRIEQFKQGDIVKDDTSPTGYKAFHFNEQTQQWQFDPIVAPKKISGENAEVVVRAFAPKKDKEVLKKETQELVQNDKPLGEFLKNSDSKLLDEKLLANPAFAKTLSQVTSETPTQTRTADGRMDLYEKAIIKHYKLDVDPFVKYPTVDHATFQKNLVDINKAKPTFDEIKNLSNQAKQLQAKFELSGNKDAKAASDYEKTVAKIKELQGQVQPLLDYFSDDFVSEVLHLQGLQERGQQEYDSALNYFPNYKKSVVEAENRKLEDTSLLGDIGRSLGTGALNLITDVLYTGTQLTPSYFPGVDDWVDKTKDKYDMWARAKGSTGKHGDFGNFLIGASKLAPQATAIILTKNPRLASGLWVAAPTWGSSYKESLSQGLSESEAMAKATVDAGIEVFSESLVKDRSMLKGFKPSKELRELGLREFGSPAFNKQMVGELNQFKKGLVSETIIDVGGQFVEEVAALKSGQITNEITNALANTDFQTEAAGDEERHLLGQVALLTVGMKALGGSYKTPSKKSYRDVILYDAAKNENWEGTRRIIESLKAEEGIDPEYVAQLEKDLTQMAGMKFPEKVTPEQKVVLLEEVNKLRELEAKKEGVEKELQSDINEKIKEQKDKIEKIQHSPKLAKEMLDESTSKASEKIQEIAKENPEFQEQANQLTRQEGTVQPTPSVQSDEKVGDEKERQDNADLMRDILDEASTDKEGAVLFLDDKDSIHKAINAYEKGEVSGEEIKKAFIENGLTEEYIVKKFEEYGVIKPNQGTTPERSVATDVQSELPKAHAENIKTKFREQFKSKGNTDEQIDGAIALMDARAKSWASEEKGRRPEQWFDRIADVKSGEFQAGDVQYQGGKLRATILGAMTMLQPMKVSETKVAARTEQTTKYQSKDERAVVDILKKYYQENNETPPQEVIDRALYLWNKFGRPEILPDSTSKDERAFATNEDGKIKIGNITNFDDFIAELSHSAQYVSGKKMDDRQYATQEERDKVEYERKGSMEYKAHKLVEPILAKYIFSGDSTELNKIQYQEGGSGKQGALETLKDGRVVIHALESPDFSTMVHEIAHVFEKDLTAAEQKVVDDFGGSEAFARGFERYLRNGIAPSKEMIPLFQKFRNWLMDIYKSLSGTPIEKRISPEIKKIFDRLLTEKNQVSQVSEAGKEKIIPESKSKEGATEDVPPAEPLKGGVPEIKVIEGREGQDLSGIKKALVSEDIIKGTDFEKIGDKEMMAMGRKILDSGEVNPDALVTKIITDGKGVLTPAEVVGLITYKRDVDNAVKDKTTEFNKKKAAGEETGTLGVEIAKLEKQIEDYNVMSLITAQQQSLAFRLRQYLLDQNYNAVREIERYKKVNNGAIPPEVEARIKAVEKELKEVKEKLAKAEEANRDVEGQEAVDNIKEKIDRENQQKSEKEKKTFKERAKKAADTFRKLKTKPFKFKDEDGNEHDITKMGFSWNDLVELGARIIEKTGEIADGIKAVFDKIQNAAWYKKLSEKDKKRFFTELEDYYKTEAEDSPEGRRIKQLEKQLEDLQQGIVKSRNEPIDSPRIQELKEEIFEAKKNLGLIKGRPLPEPPAIKLNNDGSLRIPPKMIEGLVENGVTDINELVDNIYDEAVKIKPDVTKREVRDYITGYGEKVNPTATDLDTQINTAKRVGKLLSELEDLQKMTPAQFLLKYQRPKPGANKITDAERELKRKIRVISNEQFGDIELKTDEQKIKEEKQRVRDRIAELERQKRTGDFSKKKKKPKPTDEELEKLKIEEQKLIAEVEEIQYKNELKNRSLHQKIEDGLYEWTLGITRGLTLGVDLSAIGIQGMRHLFISPVKSAQAFWESLKFLANEKYGDRFLARLKASPYYPQMSQTGLIIDDKVSKVNIKEAIGISNKVNYIWNKLVSPVLGFGNKTATEWFRKKNPYAAGQRAFDGFVNVLRTKLYIEQAKELERSGYSFEADPEVFKKSAGLVNTETASAHLGKADLNSKWLNLIFTAPRKFVSEFKLYTPYAFIYYARLPKPVRKRALLNAAKFTVSFFTVNAAIWALRKDWDDEEDDHFWDITSSDFMTHKIGNKRIGIGGGAKSMMNFIGRFWKGEYTDQHGKTTKLGERFGKEINSRADLTISFTTGKFTPLLGTTYKKLDESRGREIDNTELARNLLIPMWMQDLKDIYKDDPPTVGAFINIMSILGAQTRVVEPKKSAYDSLTTEEKKDPTLKPYIDMGISFPEFDPSKIQTKEVNGKVTERLSDYDPKVQEEYLVAKKKYLKEELQNLKGGTEIFAVDSDGTAHLVNKNSEWVDMVNGEVKVWKQIEFKDLSKEQLQNILSSSVYGKVSKMAKEEVLSKYKSTPKKED